MSKFGWRWRRDLFLASSLLAIAAPAWPAAAADASAPSNQIEEVIVTAERRATNLLETPVAVSSVSGETMQSRHLQTLADLTTQMPGVQFAQGNTNTYVTIRGIGNGTNLQGADPGVAFHLDGVYLATTGLAGSAFLDVDHVEVLRGPQGTLFGRNATGGVVNVISRGPTKDFEGEVGAWVGVDPKQIHVDGAMSGPLNGSGTLLGRFSARRDYNEGYTPNLSLSGPRRLDDQDSYALRGQVEAKPTQDLSLGLTVDYDAANQNGQSIFLLGAPAVVNGVTVSLPPSVVAAQDAAKMGLPSAIPGNLGDRRAAANQGLFKATFLGIRGNLDWRVPGGDLKVLAAYDQVHELSIADGDGTDANFTFTDYSEHAHQAYGEVLYTSNKIGRFDFLVGANVFRQTQHEFVAVPINSIRLAVLEPSTLESKSYAAFTHGEFELTDRAKLFAGIRYTHDQKDMTEANNFVNGGRALSHGASWEKVTYEVGASYQLAEDSNAYLKYATGFKSGGFAAASLAPPFNPETDANIEAGLKGLYFDRKLQAQIAAFHMDYNDLQVNQVIGAVAVITNAAKARINGVEMEFVAVPTTALRAEVNATWLDAKFERFLTADSARPSLGVLNLAGNTMPWAPRLSYSVGLYYTLPVDAPGSMTLGGRYYWKSKTYFTEFNLPVSGQGAVGRVDLSLNYESQDKLWEAGLFARNLTDQKVVQRSRTVSALLNSASLGQLDPGRDLGVSLRRRF
jgi:iron complex outermembrane receptor protein